MASTPVLHKVDPVARAAAEKPRTQRAAARRAMLAAPKTYPPGYFTALLWPKNRWPYVGWEPALKFVDPRHGIAASQRSSAARDAAHDRGDGLAAGTVLMPGTPKDQPRPGRMTRS